MSSGGGGFDNRKSAPLLDFRDLLKRTTFLESLFIGNALAMELSRHSENPENQAGILRRFSDYSESHSRETSAMRLRLGGRNDSGNGEREKRGFTLAEVLITLGIIGIVAAMTLPTLVQKQQEKIWVNQFKTAYSILSQAYVSAFQEHGLPDQWDLLPNDKDSNQKVFDYLSPYLKISKDVGFGYTGVNEAYKYLNNPQLKTEGWSGNASKHRVFVLANGMKIAIMSYTVYEWRGTSLPLVSLGVDINGDKGPNTFGKDFFLLYLSKKNNINFPIISGPPQWWLESTACSTTIAPAWYGGGGCSIWLIKHGNMDYLHREITNAEWRQ